MKFNCQEPPKQSEIFKASVIWADAFYKSFCPYVWLCVPVCLFTFEVPFKGLSAPTSQSRMSKMFRVLESLGKSNGKKWCQIRKLLPIKGFKLLCKKMVFEQMLPYWAGYFWYQCFSLCLPPLTKVQCPNFFGFLNPWGKSNGNKLCHIWTFFL